MAKEMLLDLNSKLLLESATSSINLTNVEACRICLATDVKMYSLQNTNLGRCVDSIAVIDNSNEGLLQYVCYQCAPSLRKCYNLIERSRIAHATLLDIFTKNGQVTKTLIQEQNKSELKLQSPLDSYFLQDYYYIKYDDDTNTSEFVKPKLEPKKEKNIYLKSEAKDEAMKEIELEQINKSLKDDDKNSENEEATDAEIDAIIKDIMKNAATGRLSSSDNSDDDDDVQEIKVDTPVIEVPSDGETAEDFISFDPQGFQLEKRGRPLISQRFQKHLPRAAKPKGVSKKSKKKRQKLRLRENELMTPCEPDIKKYFDIVEIKKRNHARKFNCKSCPKIFDYMDEAKDHMILGCNFSTERRNSANSSQSVITWSDWNGNK